jgi:E3 SUMO-protein ligase PIAS1
MVVMLVQVTTVNQLIERVKKGKFRSREDVLAQRTCTSFFFHVVFPHVQWIPGAQAAKDEDEDIVSGPQKTTLKCPVSSPAFAN